MKGSTVPTRNNNRYATGSLTQRVVVRRSRDCPETCHQNLYIIMQTDEAESIFIFFLLHQLFYHSRTPPLAQVVICARNSGHSRGSGPSVLIHVAYWQGSLYSNVLFKE